MGRRFLEGGRNPGHVMNWQHQRVVISTAVGRRKKEKDGSFLPTGVKTGINLNQSPPSTHLFLLGSFLAFLCLPPLLPCSGLAHEATERSVSSGARESERYCCGFAAAELLL